MPNVYLFFFTYVWKRKETKIEKKAVLNNDKLAIAI